MEREHIVTFKLLQRPEILFDAVPITLNSPKSRAILCYLIMEKSVSRESLAGLIWGNDSPETAKKHLRDCLYLMKKQLGRELVTAKGREILQLNPAYTFVCDAELFLNADNVDLYSGDFLKDFYLADSDDYEEWIKQHRSQLRNEYLRRLLQLAQEAADSHNFAEAERYLQSYIQEDTLSEKAAVSLMMLYHRQKDYRRAASTYQRIRKALSEELGIPPLRETSALYYSIMDEWNRQADESNDTGEEVFSSQQNALHLITRACTDDTCSSMILCGEPGVGKTYVLTRFLNSVLRRDHSILTATCFKTKIDTPLYSWQTIMVGLTKIISERGLYVRPLYLQRLSSVFPCFLDTSDKLISENEIMADDELFSRTFLALLSVITETQPLLLVFEDIQWMDMSSLHLLDQVFHALRPERIHILASCRTPVAPILNEFFSSAQEDGLLQYCSLKPFSAEETDRFIERNSEYSLPDSVKEKLFQVSQGNALMLTQLLKSLTIQNGSPVFLDDAESILRFHLDNLSENTLQVLNMIAMFPDFAPYSILAKLSDKGPRELGYICQELCRRSIVAELNDGGALSLVITRPEYRELLYQQIPPINRHILHQSIIDIVRSLPPEKYPNQTDILEYHYIQSGDDFNAFCCKVDKLDVYINSTFSFIVGNNASIFDSNSDEHLWNYILGLENELHKLRQKYPQRSALNEIQTSLLYTKSCFGMFTGRYNDVLPILEGLLKNPISDPRLVVKVHRQLANYGIQIYDVSILAKHIEEGLVAAVSCGDLQHEAMLTRYRGLLLIMQERFGDAKTELKNSIERINRAFPPGVEHDLQLAYAHNYMGDAFRLEGDYRSAAQEYQRAISISKHCGVCSHLAVFYSGIAITQFAQREFDQAKQSFIKANELFEHSRNKYGKMSVETYLSLYALAEGDYVCARQFLTQASYHAEQFGSSRDRSFTNLIKAIARKRCDTLHVQNELTALLCEPCNVYIEQALMHGKFALLGRELLNCIFSQNDYDTNILSVFWAKYS